MWEESSRCPNSPSHHTSTPQSQESLEDGWGRLYSELSESNTHPPVRIPHLTHQCRERHVATIWKETYWDRWSMKGICVQERCHQATEKMRVVGWGREWWSVPIQRQKELSWTRYTDVGSVLHPHIMSTTEKLKGFYFFPSKLIFPLEGKPLFSQRRGG